MPLQIFAIQHFSSRWSISESGERITVCQIPYIYIAYSLDNSRIIPAVISEHNFLGKKISPYQFHFSYPKASSIYHKVTGHKLKICLIASPLALTVPSL